MHNNSDDTMWDREQTNPQKWLDYLEGKLPPDEERELEEEIARSEFLRDAMEGLRPIQGTVDLPKVVQQLNQQLGRQLSAQKNKRARRSLPSQQWVWVSILVILTVCLLGYYLYSRLHR